MKLLKTISLISLSFLTACGAANEHSIFRTTEFENGKAVFVDAKQRGLLSSQMTRAVKQSDGSVITQKVTQFCTEPSPDAFTVLSSSIGLSASLSQAQKADAALQFSRSISESGSNIGLRTQTITVLRDMMYRLCERYMNGAITADEFTIQAGRDQRIIVSVLAIEQLTGAIKPATVILGASAQSTVEPQKPANDEDEEGDEEKNTATSSKITTTGETTGNVILQTDPENRDMTSVAGAVRDIVEMTFKTDEITLACINYIRSNQQNDFCAAYLNRQKAEEELLTLQLQEQKKAFLDKSPDDLLNN